MLDYIIMAFSPMNLGMALLGVMAGTVIGAMPGLTATMAIAVLIPITFTMEPTSALILMGALYTGAIYGGAYSAILLNTPGTPSAIATTFDGYPMTKQGKGELAISIACLSSVAGGLVGALALWFLSPPLAQIALSFGPVEYFWLAIFGLTLISGLSSGSLLKGMIGACLGLFMATIGVAAIGAEIRFTFDTQFLLGGVEIVSALIGLYCIPVVMDMIGTRGKHMPEVEQGQKMPLLEAFGILVKNKFNLARSSVIGTIAGILPGAGGSIASLISYAEAQRYGKDKDSFGKGNPAGIVATESANNATVGGGLIPTFVLGIPGTPPDAVILGALLIQGIRTGPDMFDASTPLVYTFMIGLFIATLLMLPVGLFVGRYIYKFINRIPKTALVPSIITLTLIGSYAIRNNMYDVYIMFFLGATGWLIARAGFMVSPIVLGLILGRIAEEGFVQGYVIGDATDNLFGEFFLRPIAMGLIILIVGVLTMPILKRKFFKNSKLMEITGDDPNQTVTVDKAGNIVSVIIFAIGAVGFYDTLRMDDMDSFVFPRFVTAVMMLLCALHLGRNLMQGQPAKTTIEFLDGMNMPPILGMFVGIIIGLIMMPTVGFLVSATVIYLCLMTLCEFNQWTLQRFTRHGIYGVLAVGGLYVFFTAILNVPLPEGTVFELFTG